MNMNNRINRLLGIMVVLFGVGYGAVAFSGNAPQIAAVTSAPPAQTAPVTQDPPQAKQNTPERAAATVQNAVNPLSIVRKPSAYLNKHVTMTARFNKFATLGLDYKPAMRSSETYIAFLIYRPDTDKNIPLSEMKLFVTRKSAEKLIDLKEGDLVKINGVVFSTALGDAWIDAESIIKLNKDAGKDK
jgi:hypothetical protein